MSSIKKYELKPRPQVALEGAQVSLFNAGELAKWCGGEVITEGEFSLTLQVPTINGVQTAQINDFVHKNSENGRFSVMSAFDFVEGYQQVTEEQNPNA